MRRSSSIFAATVLIVGLCEALPSAQVPTTYPSANSTRTAIPKPALPALGAAGFHFIDPALGSRLLRVTDPNTRPVSVGRSFVTGSAAHQLAWNANSDTFYVRGVDGTYIPYTFDASTMTAARINPTPGVGEGGLTILSQLEPQFSFVSPNILFGTRQSAGTSHPIVRQFDFTTGTYTDILDLGTITTVAPNTYARALAGSAAAPEKLEILFGGAQQDLDFKVAVFQLGPPVTNVAVLDTLASTITRSGTTVSTNIGLGITLHHAWIDKSGRYVTLSPTNGSFVQPPPLPYFIWDTTTDIITKVTLRPGGHDALGYGVQVNQECCTTTSYDGAQWQFRSLAAPTTTRDLVNPGSPMEVFIADHTSWNNAQPGAFVPVLSTLYRYDASDPTPWRAWDDEIVAIQTNAADAAATVWRFAQHRSDIAYDGRTNSTDIYFWYLPRAMISPDGKWAMFTSNWEKTLGATIGTDIEPGGLHRNDVFIVALAPGTAPTPTVTMNTISVNPGGAIDFSVANGPANPTDWVGLFTTTAADTAYVDWMYLNGLKTPPATGVSNVALQFTAPAPSGTYHVRLFANGYTRLATSGPVSVPEQPTLRINDVSVTEGNAGTATATFTVTLNPVNTTQTVTVAYATANGTATTANSDYTASSGTLTFSPSVATRTIGVVINGDTRLEPDETVLVNLSSPVNALIGDSQGVGTITNDDVATVTINTPTVNPGGTIGFSVASGPANPTDWVALALSTAADSTYVDWIYLNGTRTAPATGVSSATLQFTAPATTGTYNIRLFANNTFTKLATSGPITVQPPPTLTINDVSVTEGNAGTTTATFTVTLNPVNTTQSVTVNYTTANGTATAGSDFVGTSGTLTFSPSVATRTIIVTVNGDTANEANETLFVNLAGATNAAIGDSQGIGTITNDDAPPAPSVTIATPSVSPGGAIGFTVANGPANAMDWVGLFVSTAADSTYVDWMYLNGTKSAPATGVSGATLQFTAPATTGTYNIRLFANNTFTRLATSGNVTVAPTPTLSIDDVSVTEGNTGTVTATFTVTLSPVNSTQTVTVNYATVNSTATSGSDYTAASGTLTFSPSVATRTISVIVNGDTASEPNETFVVNLSSAANAVIGDSQGIGTIANDDAPPTPTVTMNTPIVAPGGTISFSVANGPANPADWLGLFVSTAADTTFVDWIYLNGTRTAPAMGVSNVTLQFTAPSTTGTYNVRLFSNNTFTRLATSGPVTVGP